MLRATNHRPRETAAMKPTATGLAAALALLVAACASSGPDDGLGMRKLSWFSYLDAGDLKADCAAGSPERLRLVLNADYAEHVRTYDLRTYDLRADAKTGGAELVIRALTAANAANPGSSGSPLDPWRGARQTVSLTPKQSAALQELIAASGAFAPPPVGLSLVSSDYYWLVAGCHLGHGFVTAFPLTGDEAPAFAPALAALDGTGVAFPDLAAHQRRPPASGPRGSQDIALTFTIRIGENGLSGILPH